LLSSYLGSFLPLPSGETATMALSPRSAVVFSLAEELAKNKGRILRQNPSKSQAILFMYFLHLTVSLKLLPSLSLLTCLLFLLLSVLMLFPFCCYCVRTSFSWRLAIASVNTGDPLTLLFAGVNHRVPTPTQPSLRERRQVEIILPPLLPTRKGE
jgi:hypothetical protein